jgi:hypothetical protein
MTLRFLALSLLALALPASAAPPTARAFDRAAWKADHERIKLGLAQGYANLDWQAERLGLNLKRADAQITAMLDKATTEAEAMLAMTRFVDMFRDPHLVLRPGPPPSSARLLPTMSNVDTAPLRCSDVAMPLPPAAPYDRAPGWTPLAGAPFPSGIVGQTGFIRILSFEEERYVPVCRDIAEADPYKRRLALRAALNDLLMERIAALKARGMTRLVIDLGDNGGGSEWSSELALLLAGGTLERPAPRLVAPACDRSGVWRGEKVCSPYGLAKTETKTGQGRWTGPLVLLTDRHTASAAEEFVTWLRGNGRARTVGERTFGAGCGYVNGGTAIALKAAPIHLMVPNCSRFTNAGLNEIEGLAPDEAIDWKRASPQEALAAITQAFERG